MNSRKNKVGLIDNYFSPQTYFKTYLRKNMELLHTRISIAKKRKSLFTKKRTD